MDEEKPPGASRDVTSLVAIEVVTPSTMGFTGYVDTV